MEHCQAELIKTNLQKATWTTAVGPSEKLCLQALKGPRGVLSVPSPHWFFKKWRKGNDKFVHLSKWDNDQIETRFRAFVEDDGPRIVYIRTGATGQDLYQLNFWPIHSDMQDIAQLQNQATWTDDERMRHLQAWNEVILNRGRSFDERECMYLYTKVKSIKGPPSAPSRLLYRRSVKSDSGSLIERFPVSSEKDIEVAMEEFGMSLTELDASGMFGAESFKQLQASRTATLPSDSTTSSPVWLWLHSSGWRVADSAVHAAYEDNYLKCVGGKGDVETFCLTGKTLKMLSFVPATNCLEQAARILKTTPTNEKVVHLMNIADVYFLQGDADWSRSDTTVNWRLVCRVDEASLDFRNAMRFRLYQKFQRLSSYEIEKIWAKHGYIDLSTATIGGLPAHHAAQSSLRLDILKKARRIEEREKMQQQGQRNVALQHTIAALSSESESFMSIANTILDDVLVCPIGLCRFVEPVITRRGHTYERRFIEKWLEERGTDPMTKEYLRVSSLRPDAACKELLLLLGDASLKATNLSNNTPVLVNSALEHQGTTTSDCRPVEGQNQATSSGDDIGTSAEESVPPADVRQSKATTTRFAAKMNSIAQQMVPRRRWTKIPV